MEILVGLGVTVLLLCLGIVFGSLAERRHYADILRREDKYHHVIQTQTGSYLMPRVGADPPTLICSETTVATDYFKRFLAGIRTFFGGEIRGYNSLVERARRETLVKLLQQAEGLGFNAICNVRLEPADVGGNVQRAGQSMVCIVGSATAYHSDLRVETTKR